MDSSQFLENLKMSFSDHEQLIFIKFGVLQNHSAGVIAQNLRRLLGNYAFTDRTLRQWASTIRDGRTDVKVNSGGDHRDAAVRQERIQRITRCFEESSQWSIRSLASYVDLPLSTVHGIVRDELRMVKKFAKWVPHELTSDQKDNRVLSCEINLRDYGKTNSLP